MTGTERVVRQNRDKQIVEAAIEVFSKKGYAAASLQDVADAVGLLKGSLYHYISSKESLLYRIFQEAFEQAFTLMGQLDERGLSPDEKLREYVRGMTLFYAQNRERSSLFFSEWRHLTGDERQTVMKQRQEFESYLRTILAHAQEQGLTRDDIDVKLATRFLLTAVNGVVIWYRADGQLSATTVADQISDLACSSVLRPATSRTKKPAKASTTKPAKASTRKPAKAS
jgi:AcrR family transcriptional regulator